MLLHTDHAGVLGCEYDTDARVCMPSTGDSAKRGLRASLLAIKAVTSRTEGGGASHCLSDLSRLQGGTTFLA